MMKKRIFLLLIFSCIFISASAEDTIKKVRRPEFISIQMSEGFVMPTSRIINGETKTPNVVSLSLKYGLYSKGDKWEDYYYGMPYTGIGIYKPYYSLNKELGNPFSLFLFQGAELKKFSSGISLNYEINLGVSFNWNHYDIINNPYFEVFGSSINAHLGGNLYFKKSLSDRMDISWGVDMLHFSNGARRTPNYGLNSISANVGVSYNITKGRGIPKSIEEIADPPTFKKRIVHDVSFFVTKRTLNIDTSGVNLISKYLERSFRVVGLNYAFMWHNTRRFMWGPSVEMAYDEGSGVEISGDISDETGIYKEVVELGSVYERLTVGLSLKGELVMPGYSIFGNLGYDVMHGTSNEKRLYQLYGIKVFFIEGLSASLGVKSYNLTNSKYIYLGIGYTFCKYRRK